MATLLMPKATAVWLVENTALTFRQIADFCHLHELEVKGIADGDVGQGIKGLDPVTGGQISREEIAAGEANENFRLKVLETRAATPVQKATRGPRYTPVSRRGDRPDAIAWLLRNHPELPDSAIMRLVGTTKSTIDSIRDRTHWNISNIKQVDPVSLGLSTQLDLDLAVQRAAKRSGKDAMVPQDVRTLISAAEMLASDQARAQVAEHPSDIPASSGRPSEPDYDAESVFAKLKTLRRSDDSED